MTLQPTNAVGSFFAAGREVGFAFGCISFAGKSDDATAGLDEQGPRVLFGFRWHWASPKAPGGEH